ncbi:hypothetical protein [Acinetobacter higginsii]|uniref:hypothetical protein n=1 Tax=Acinetobacter higginsii TaxID=70347 RepID=UPI001F61AE67|nr:hypothetical protein [Acinetobacter higginsii]MCI3877554.1 hypothetical protein [Acinetobacter higginsii]
MKYFKNQMDQVFAYDLDGSQDYCITKDMKKMTKNEIARHIYPENYLSDMEKKAAYLETLAPLTRRQFKLMLIEHDLDESINTLINKIEDIKKRKALEIELKDAQTFERLSPSVLSVFNLLALDESMVNVMWERAILL